MDEERNGQKNLIDTTDCLEAVGVFRCWKNLLFAIIILCLLLLQACFWIVDFGCVRTCDKAETKAAAVEAPEAPKPEEAEVHVVSDAEKIQQAAKEVAADANSVAEAQPAEQKPKKTAFFFKSTAGQLTGVIRFLNFVLIIAAALYCLTMLFSLKISLVGRLGGMNHISRAFFLSLVFVTLLLPWQLLFPSAVTGAMYTPGELLTPCDRSGIFSAPFYYLRFVGYGLLIVLILMFAQFRSIRWAKTILRRLEIM